MGAQPNITPSEPGNVTSGGEYVRANFRENVVEGTTARIRPRPTHPRGPQDLGPEERAKIRDLWTKAKAAAERLWSSAKADQSEMFGAGVELNDLFTRLWDLRAHRDDNWIGILDQARTALGSLAASGIECATPDQCWKFLQLVEMHLSPATKSVSDLEGAVRFVSEMGLNPYAGLESLGDA